MGDSGPQTPHDELTPESPSDVHTHSLVLSMVTHSFNPSTGAGGSLGVPGQSELHSKSLSQKKQTGNGPSLKKCLSTHTSAFNIIIK